MARNLVYGKPTWPAMGPYLFRGYFLQQMFARMFQGGIQSEDAITATPGGTQAASYQLLATFNNVTTVATNGDGVCLPKAIAGSRVVIDNNDASHSLNVYGQLNSGDTINGVAGSTAFAQAHAKRVDYICLTKGAWLTSTASIP